MKLIRKYGHVFFLTILIQLMIVYAGRELPRTPNAPPSASRLGKYKTAAVVSDGVPCSDVGRDVLADGGNAIDAAIATVFCVGIANPHSTGIGGGSVMTIWDPKTKKARSLMAREVAPLAATENMYGGNSTISQMGPLAVAVPGELAGSWAAHQEYGKLPWSRLVLPAADLAENGLAVNRALASALRQRANIIIAEPSMADFVDPATGNVYQEGDILKRPTLANTLREIATNGADTFYKGSIADKMVADLQLRGSIITKQDLINYSADWMESAKVELNGGFTLYSMPPPASGVLMGYILNILDTYNLRKDVKADVADDPLTYHRIIEAFKHAYAQRTKLADPRFVPEVNELAVNLTSESLALETRTKINDSFTSNDPEYYGAVLYVPDDKGTSHVSVLDGDGMAVAITSTVNLYFGAKFASEQTGVIFNDEMDDFGSPNITNDYGVPPSPANFIVPGKRPVSSMTPTIIVDSAGKVRSVIGASGGTRITTSTTYAIIRNLWFGETIKEAIDSYRIHHQLFPMNLRFENGFPTNISQVFASKGHNVTVDDDGACVMGIAVEADGFIYANSDVRKAGDVAGIDPVEDTTDSATIKQAGNAILFIALFLVLFN